MYLSVVLSQCSMGSLLPCADLDCYAPSGGVSVCVCVYYVFIFILTSSPLCLKSFPSYLPTLSYLCSCLLKRINSEVTFPVEVRRTLIPFSCTVVKKKIAPVLFVVYSV